jgi:hypothetical protein
MPRHGDCKHFIPDTANMAASEGMCMEIAGDDGMPEIVNVFEDIKKCEKYEVAERIKTNTSEFTWDKNVRATRGFDEK